MSRPIGVGVAGIGNAGAEHLREFAAHPGARVVSIIDLDEERAEAARASLGLECAIHETLDQALGDDDLDAVVIATPNSLHPAMTAKAALAGKHILLEKPVGLDNQAIDSMVDVVRTSGVICQVNMILRWHPDRKHRGLA